jgi:hypothetical protein
MTNIQLINRIVIIFEVPTFVGEELCEKSLRALRLMDFF